MQTRHRSITVIVAFLFLLIYSSSPAQSISTNPISGSEFCGGDSLFVDFTCSGSFEIGNVFILQLSDSNGSFSSGFQNLGSVLGINSGTIHTVLPNSLSPSTHYRIRVIGSKPYREGSDNGNDLIMGLRPYPSFIASRYAVSVGDTVVFTSYTIGATSILWDFGDGASAAWSTSPITPPISYSTIGSKTVTLTASSIGGCSTTYKLQDVISVYGCNPQIPDNAQIDSVSSSSNTLFNSGNIWLQPGITLIMAGGGSYTIFAELGSSVLLNNPSSTYLTIYLKAGSSYNHGLYNYYNSNITLIYDPGAGLYLGGDENLLECPSLSFDYSHAPHSRFVDDVTPSNGKTAGIHLYPNPVSQMIFVDASSAPREVIMNDELGNTVVDAKENLTSKLEISTASLPSGTYYLQLIYNDRIESNKVIVVH